jgi:hypothetical protein
MPIGTVLERFWNTSGTLEKAESSISNGFGV